MSSSVNTYGLVRNLPIWKFFYKGNHRRPIRTTLAVVENKGNVVTGYVLRRGNEVVTRLQDAPIHSFKKSQIAVMGQTRSKKGSKSKTTLTKHSLLEFMTKGA